MAVVSSLKAPTTVILDPHRDDCTDVVSYLLQAGSNPDAVNIDGKTPLDLARSSEMEALTSFRPVGKQHARFCA